ncbi:MAG TPA: START domain-containing protein [Bacteriovoracaceae bacterium]|nr:START domain-containing protein [Bacteriovoracaceae bacterium]
MKVIMPMFLVLLSLNSVAQIQPKWEKVDTQKNVDVYKGEVKGSDVVALRGVSTIEAPMAKVLSVIYDVSRIKEWMSDVNTVRVLEKKSKYEKIEYNRTDAPWPVSDRDFVYEAKVSVNKPDQSVEILIKSVEHKDAPPVDGVVRGELQLSRYFLRSVEDGTKTYIEVEILADPKGSLPKWVVNIFQAEWPVNTVNGIRKIATEKDFKVHPDVAESVAEMEKK